MVPPPRDHAGGAPGSAMWTRTPGLKLETLSQYQRGADYFSHEDELRRYIFSQAALLGDAELVQDALDELSHSASTVPADSPAPEAAKPVVTVDDIAFSDSSDNSCHSSPAPQQRPPQSAQARPAAAVSVSASAAVRTVGAKRRVIADSDDDDDKDSSRPGVINTLSHSSSKSKEVRAEEEDEEVQVLSQFPASCKVARTAQSSASVPSASSAPPVPVAHKSASVTAARSSNATGNVQRERDNQLFDLTSPPKQNSSSSSNKRDRTSSGVENTDPNRHATDRDRGSHSGAGKGKAPHSGAGQGSESRHSSSTSGSGSGSGSGSVDEGDTWACVLCTLENSAATHPTECRLCG
jgi:hypothetical protein